MAGPALFDKRILTLIYRVEPGCLGPEGVKYVEEFCNFSNEVMAKLGKKGIQYFFTPRYNKLLPEIDYRLLNKPIKSEQLAAYLAQLGQYQEDMEADLGEKVAVMIDQFFSR